MLELIRRLLLAAGIAGFFAMALTTVPDLVLVAPIDFAAEMAKKYPKKTEPRLRGVMELAEDFIQKNTQPGSLQEYIDRKTENRLIKVAGPDWEIFFRIMGQKDNNPYAARLVAKRQAYVFKWEETPLGTLKDEITTKSKTWTINYLILEPGASPQYLEVGYGYGYEPKKIGAPASLVFPWRNYCWAPLLAGVAGFFLLGRRRPQAEVIYHHYLSSCLPLDICGFVFFSLFFAIPWWIADPTAQMWGEDLGVTLICWLAATGALSLVAAAACHAAFAIKFEPGRLVISRLFGSRSLHREDISSVLPLLVGGIESGIILELQDRSRVNLDWSNLVNYQFLLATLQNYGIQESSVCQQPQ